MPPLNNPASRLWSLLAKGHEVPGNEPVWKAWVHLLELGDDTDLGECMRHFAAVYALPRQIRAAVEAREDLNRELLLRQLPRVEERLYSMSLHQPWAEFIRPIDPPLIESMEYIADALARVAPEPIIDKQTVKRLHEEIRVLFDEVADADLEDDLRESLLYHLQAMDDALRQVKTRGVSALAYAVEAAVGAELIRTGRGEPPPETGPRRKFWDFVARATVVVGLVNQTLALPPAVQDLAGDPERQLPPIVVQVNDVEGDVDVEIDARPETDAE